jgi:hypothetical protein
MRGLAPLTRQRQVLFIQITHQVGNHSSLLLRNTLLLLDIRHNQFQALETHLQRRCHSSNLRRLTLLRRPHFLPDREAYQRHRVYRNDPPSVLLRLMHTSYNRCIWATPFLAVRLRLVLPMAKNLRLQHFLLRSMI